ncbi:hypothetical protein AA309_09095 [Microvirga vignae]|uniref:Uncharacterized protein n=2 Tax=Microvirga vignae TaxID=1225564 RepID=A0A0H1REG2_9HYPH|nr:hypothetical protein AA309_09095 [Microvirga vignae]
MSLDQLISLLVAVTLIETMLASGLGVRPGGILAMLTLLGASLGAGWVAGGRWSGDREAVAFTTSIRNVGLGLVIAAGGFASPSRLRRCWPMGSSKWSGHSCWRCGGSGSRRRRRRGLTVARKN